MNPTMKKVDSARRHEEHQSGVRGARPLALAALTALMAGACDSSHTPSRQAIDALDQTVLGTAQSFAVLGGSTLTNTGTTTVYGDLGVNPGLAVTGFPPGLVTGGTIHAGDAVALQAQSDTTAAFTTLAGQAATAELTGQDLGGQTLTAGVYHFASSAQLTGALTLDAEGDPDAVFVFQVGSTLTTASNSSVLALGGARDCNIFWQVGSSATLGTTTAFKGNIVALTSITLDTGATVSGRALARNAAVTMDTNGVSILACGADTSTSGAGGQGGGTGAGGSSTAASSTSAASSSATTSAGSGGGGGCGGAGGSSATSSSSDASSSSTASSASSSSTGAGGGSDCPSSGSGGGSSCPALP